MLNRGVPTVYGPFEIQNWPTAGLHPCGYRPSRPIPFQAVTWRKFVIAWRVFTGRYDALDWEKVREHHPCCYQASDHAGACPPLPLDGPPPPPPNEPYRKGC